MNAVTNIIGDILVKFSEFARNFGGASFGGFEFVRPAWDILVLFFLLVAIFLYGMSLGKNRMLMVMVSMYLALALVNAFPYTDQLVAQFQESGTFAVRVTSFVGIVLALFFLLSHSALKAAFSYPKHQEESQWFKVFIFSVLQMGLLASVVLSYATPNFRDSLSPLTLTLFGSQNAMFWWILLPIVVMSMIKKKKDKKPLA